MSLSKALRLYDVQQIVSCSFPGKYTNLFGSHRPLSPASSRLLQSRSLLLLTLWRSTDWAQLPKCKVVE